MLEIDDSTEAGLRVLCLRGRLDTNTSADFDRHCSESVGLGERICISLEQIEYVSSAGLRVFLMLAKKLQRGGGALVLCSMPPSVREVFEIAGFSRILNIVEDRGAAAARLG